MYDNHHYLINQFQTVKDIIAAMIDNCDKPSYNMETGMKRLKDSINETLIMLDMIIVSQAYDGKNCKAIRGVLNIVDQQLQTLDSNNIQKSALTNISDILDGIEVPTIYIHFIPFCYNLMCSVSDIFDTPTATNDLTAMMDDQIKIMQEILTKNEPINFFIPEYHRFSSSFLSNMLPQLLPHVSKENFNLYVATTEAETINYKDRENFAGVAIGNFDSFMATNNAFDIIYNIPKFVKESVNGTSYNIFLMKRYWNYLKEGGFLILGLPSFLLTRDIRVYLQDHFILKGIHKHNLHIPYHEDAELIFYTFVLQKAYKINIPETLPQYEILTDLALCNDKNINYQQKIPSLPYTPFVPIRLFKGEKPDFGLLMSILSQSPLYKEKPVQKKHELKPILPFERGQIGLVLASGCLDGIIDEKNGYKHVIRGRVFKSTRVINSIAEESANSRDGKIENLQITNNLTEINVMTGNGIYKSIMVPVAM